MRLTASEEEVQMRDINVDIATDAFGQAAQIFAGGKLLSSYEALETLLMEAAQISTDVGNVLSVLGSAASVVPQFEVSAEPWGVGGATDFGGSNVGSGSRRPQPQPGASPKG